jgi:hypothetical protein
MSRIGKRATVRYSPSFNLGLDIRNLSAISRKVKRDEKCDEKCGHGNDLREIPGHQIRVLEKELC